MPRVDKRLLNEEGLSILKDLFEGVSRNSYLKGLHDARFLYGETSKNEAVIARDSLRYLELPPIDLDGELPEEELALLSMMEETDYLDSSLIEEKIAAGDNLMEKMKVRQQTHHRKGFK